MTEENQEIGTNHREDNHDPVVEHKRNSEITTKFRNRLEYLSIFFILQSGNYNFISTATKCAKFKGISFLIVYYGIHHIFIAPLQCQQLFLGYYSKHGYMKIWNIFPIGYGIGASMMALSLYTCINWSALTGQLLLQFILAPFIPESYWTACYEESENPSPCYALSSERKENFDCNGTYYPAVARYYVMSNLWRPDEKPNGIGPPNTKWIMASALVWIVVSILTVRDIKSFKGVFVKLVYFVTTVSLLMTIIQWRSHSKSEKASLLMLDFTGLYSYKIWVKALTHAILMSHICEGTLIQLGSYGTENTMPDTDALLVGFVTSILQYIKIYYLYSSYGSMAETYALDINCLVWPYEPIVMAMFPTQLSLLPMARLWIITGFLILLVKGIMEMTLVFTLTVNSFSEAFPSVKAYRSYLVTVTALSCFLISIIFTTKAGSIFAHQSLERVGTLVALLILAIMSSLILFSYSVTRLCDDIQFMHKFEPTVLMKAVFYLTPLIATYYTVLHITDFLSLPTRLNGLYDDLSALQPFLIVCCVSLTAPLIIVGLVLYGIHVQTHTVGLLFYPTKHWGNPDEEVNKARSRFNPRRELRYMVKKPCAHVCLLDDERMQLEIEKREMVRDALKQYGFKVFNEKRV